MLRARLNDDLKIALEAKDQLAVATLRLILAALKDRDIAARGKGNCDGVGEDEILELLQKMVRQRRESIEAYSNGGRQDLADREAAEIEVIKRFLPKELDETEVRSAIDQTISELEASSIKDMGKVIGTLKERYAGRMDFGKASQLVKERLA
ncbi:MAG: GatB/YqeY domain-containing protein [Rhodospirillales bacterium]|nr:GatB/YqeY domain-containing protein [Rhodospirillales bacterium]